MEYHFNQMDSRSIHLAPYTRRFTWVPTVETIGFMPHKREEVKHTFDSCNFSFILSGRGTYDYAGETYAVTAPCVILQWPDAPMMYGPAANEMWSELYLIYPRCCLDVLTRSSVFDPGNPPVRSITAELSDAVSKLYALTSANPINADLIDIACWNLIVSSFGPGASPAQAHPTLAKCREYLSENLAGSFDVEALATSVSMSLSTLRRYWMKEHGSQTFREYRDMLLLQRSCRLLVETSSPIKEVAGALGFSDVYYFSRRFHQLAGCTPTEYRRAHAVPDGGVPKRICHTPIKL